MPLGRRREGSYSRAAMATAERSARSAPSGPPHNLEAEASVLGAILLSDRTMYGLVIEDGLAPEDFYREQHRVVYAGMLGLYEASEPIDVLTVTEQLRKTGRLEAAGGEAAVASLAGSVPAAGNVRHYGQIVRENALLRRLLSTAQDRGKVEDLSKGRAEKRWPEIVEASSRLASAPIYVDDSSDVGILEIRAKARRLHHERPQGLGLVIVDYLQLMRAEARVENRTEQVGHMSRGLKILARELNVPVIALSQLNRGVEARNDKRPLLSDLRESGSIEQDADLVVFIYRDDYYNGEDSEHPGEAELLIAKHRNGPLGRVNLVFQSEYPRFMSLARDRVAA